MANQWMKCFTTCKNFNLDFKSNSFKLFAGKILPHVSFYTCVPWELKQFAFLPHNNFESVFHFDRMDFAPTDETVHCSTLKCASSISCKNIQHQKNQIHSVFADRGVSAKVNYEWYSDQRSTIHLQKHEQHHSEVALSCAIKLTIFRHRQECHVPHMNKDHVLVT